MKNYILLLFVMMPFATLAETTENTDNVYTLYHNSPYLEELDKQGKIPEDYPDYNRVHIATFDSTTSDNTYNKFMCERVKGFFEEKLLPKKPHHSKFWCEKGRYKKNN